MAYRDGVESCPGDPEDPETRQGNREDWTLLRQGAQHEIWLCGSTSVALPRHNELKLGLVLAISRRLESELGHDWRK
jgi:hypothetical protein